MKKISLINPEQAKQLFSRHNWTDENNYFIKVESVSSELLLVNAATYATEQSGNELEVGFGTPLNISLEEYENDVTIEVKDIIGLGALLLINHEPYLLRVYKTSDEASIQQIGELFPELRIVDFGSGKNEYITNLNGIVFCSKLQWLNLDNCSNLRNISGLKALPQIKTLYLDAFFDSSQYHFISSCKALQALSLNSCKNIRDLTPIAGLSALTTLCLDRTDLSDLTPIAGLSALTTLKLQFCKNLSDLTPIAGLSALKTLYLTGTDLSDLTPIAGLSALQDLSLDYCKNIRDLTPIGGLSALKTLWLSETDLSDLTPISGLPALETINVLDCENLEIVNLSDLFSLKNIFFGKKTPIRSVILSNLDSLISLDLSYKMIDNSNLVELELSSLPQLNHLNICGAEKLSYISLTSVVNLINLDISQTDIENLNFISNLKKLKFLDAYCLDKIKDFSILKNNKSLERIRLGSWDMVDFTPFETIPELNNLIDLELISCWHLENLDFVKRFRNLSSINLAACEGLEDISSLSYLTNLSNINLGKCRKINDISSLRYLKLDNLEISNTGILEIPSIDYFKYTEVVNLSGCFQLKNINNIAHCKNIKALVLNNCTSLKDITPLKKIKSLNLLILDGCSSLCELDSLSHISSLISLDIKDCKNITRVAPLCSLTELSELYLNDTPNIRDIRKLASLKSLTKLEWIDSVECSYILMRNAINRHDSQYTLENLENWINELDLAKEAIAYSSSLLGCLFLTNGNDRRSNLLSLFTAMRSRGLQSEERNDLDAYTWETWCNLALSLDKVDAISCLQAALNELNIERESEVILGPVIIAFAELIEKHPEENEVLLAWVHVQLQQLENHREEQRQIAPSAAVFFASLNKKEDVLFWLKKATDEKAPLWRERVLHALIKFYAKKENFTEARRLLDEMHIQEEKDYAIATLAQTMAASHPVEAGFLLDEINELHISSEAAHKMLEEPSMLSAPQGIYQLLLHLQSNPNELASALEMIIERDTIGSIAESVKQLFIQTQTSGPSAAVLLELCKHPSIADFLKPRALEKYKSELQERANQELTQSVPYLITEMLNAALLEEDEARELTQLMQKL